MFFSKPMAPFFLLMIHFFLSGCWHKPAPVKQASKVEAAVTEEKPCENLISADIAPVGGRLLREPKELISGESGTFELKRVQMFRAEASAASAFVDVAIVSNPDLTKTYQTQVLCSSMGKAASIAMEGEGVALFSRKSGIFKNRLNLKIEVAKTEMAKTKASPKAQMRDARDENGMAEVRVFGLGDPLVNEAARAVDATAKVTQKVYALSEKEVVVRVTRVSTGPSDTTVTDSISLLYILTEKKMLENDLAVLPAMPRVRPPVIPVTTTYPKSVDVLIAVSDQNAMLNSPALQNSIQAFMGRLEAKNLNYRVALSPLSQNTAITQVAVSKFDSKWGAQWVPPYKGALRTGSSIAVLPQDLTPVPITSATSGESGISSLVKTLEEEARGLTTGDRFLRRGSQTVVVIVSAIDDTSEAMGAQPVNRPLSVDPQLIERVKDVNGAVVFSIVNATVGAAGERILKVGCQGQASASFTGLRYMELAQKTGGRSIDYCSADAQDLFAEVARAL